MTMLEPEVGRTAAASLDPFQQLRRSNTHERQTARDLRQALADGQFVLYYQPIVSLPGRHLTAVEALVRWEHPERGLIPPTEFIPLAEQSGFIAELGRWILYEACRQVRTWQQTSPALADLRVAVNLSALQLTPAIVAEVSLALADSGLARRCLDLEITESVVMADIDGSPEILQALANLGVGLSIDDFGTGFSSLSYLKRLPVNGLKIDKSFVDDLETDPRDVAIMGAIIALAAALGLNQIAEGIETEAQRRQLEAMGCAQAQGYLFSRPLPAEGFVEAVAALLPPPTPDPSDEPDGERPVSVLVCDDEPSIRKLYRRALLSMHAEVTEVADAEHCLAELATHPAELVILDVGLPGRDGLEIIAEIRALAPLTQIVVVSGVVSAEVNETAMAAGASACVPKMQFLPLVRALVESCRL